MFTSLAAPLFEISDSSSPRLDHYWTNWRYGQRDINILMLGVAYRGIAIPVLWTLLPKRGNSSTDERKALLERFIRVFGKERILGVLGDREFTGKEWFRYLQRERIPFVFRIRANTLVPNVTGQTTGHVARLFHGLNKDHYHQLPGARTVWGVPLFISAVRLEDGNLLILVTTVTHDTAPDLYKKRWEIETLFSCLKTRGFHFEDTRITEPERIGRMLAVLAVAFAWAHKTGEWLIEHVNAITIKNHGRPAVSIFKYGLDHLTHACLNHASLPNQFNQWCKLLSLQPQKIPVNL